VAPGTSLRASLFRLVKQSRETASLATAKKYPPDCFGASPLAMTNKKVTVRSYFCFRSSLRDSSPLRGFGKKKEAKVCGAHMPLPEDGMKTSILLRDFLPHWWRKCAFWCPPDTSENRGNFPLDLADSRRPVCVLIPSPESSQPLFCSLVIHDFHSAQDPLHKEASSSPGHLRKVVRVSAE